MKDSILVHAMYTPLEDNYICYFDILGYKDFLDKNPDEHKHPQYNFHSRGNVNLQQWRTQGKVLQRS